MGNKICPCAHVPKISSSFAYQYMHTLYNLAQIKKVTLTKPLIFLVVCGWVLTKDVQMFLPFFICSSTDDFHSASFLWQILHFLFAIYWHKRSVNFNNSTSVRCHYCDLIISMVAVLFWNWRPSPIKKDWRSLVC